MNLQEAVFMARRLKLTEEDAKKIAKDGIELTKKWGLPLKNKKKNNN